MTFYQRLQAETAQGRQYLLSAPIIGQCLKGSITLDHYIAFLTQAFHHVKQTVPLLMACGARLPERREWLRTAIGEYIEEEMGHQEWVLNDIAACGYDKEAARARQPQPATELMVAYAWDMVNRVDPLGFFGMVHVLEGTSVTIADKAADAIREQLGLPRKAFSYLYSHGALDQQHVKFFENLMDRITDGAEQQLIIHAANMFYQLYGNIFRGLTPAHGIPQLQEPTP
jgi:long-chain acyl-CoA synthetase